MKVDKLEINKAISSSLKTEQLNYKKKKKKKKQFKLKI